MSIVFTIMFDHRHVCVFNYGLHVTDMEEFLFAAFDWFVFTYLPENRDNFVYEPSQWETTL